ncbi:hypothetical protein DFH06DRAFT_1249594 [Mycena polygramma]|nr:hypothetical protein DFH06DRAFT_1249594 [Mycena polygramma]
MSSEATSPCSSRDFDPDSSESSSERGDDIHSQGEVAGETYSAEVDAKGETDKDEDHVNVDGEGETGENQVDEDSDVDAVGYTDDDTDDEADEEECAANVYPIVAEGSVEMASAPQFEEQSEDANNASVAVPLQQRIMLRIPARRRAAQAPSPIAGTSHSMAVDTLEDQQDPDSEYELSDDDEYGPDVDEYGPDVKRVRTNSGEAAGKKGKGKASERKRRAPAAVQVDPATPKWERLDNGWRRCLWQGTCGHLVKSRSGINRHYNEVHLKTNDGQCPACEIELKMRVLDRHLEGKDGRSFACKGGPKRLQAIAERKQQKADKLEKRLQKKRGKGRKAAKA